MARLCRCLSQCTIIVQNIPICECKTSGASQYQTATPENIILDARMGQCIQMAKANREYHCITLTGQEGRHHRPSRLSAG